MEDCTRDGCCSDAGSKYETVSTSTSSGFVVGISDCSSEFDIGAYYYFYNMRAVAVSRMNVSAIGDWPSIRVDFQNVVHRRQTCSDGRLSAQNQTS